MKLRMATILGVVTFFILSGSLMAITVTEVTNNSGEVVTVALVPIYQKSGLKCCAGCIIPTRTCEEEHWMKPYMPIIEGRWLLKPLIGDWWYQDLPGSFKITVQPGETKKLGKDGKGIVLPGDSSRVAEMPYETLGGPKIFAWMADRLVLLCKKADGTGVVAASLCESSTMVLVSLHKPLSSTGAIVPLETYYPAEVSLGNNLGSATIRSGFGHPDPRTLTEIALPQRDGTIKIVPVIGLKTIFSSNPRDPLAGVQEIKITVEDNCQFHFTRMKEIGVTSVLPV
ncbi:MAG: hypothetical protein JW725_03665 [Candidatus Babeliaceae bacterium]|nr:hypothetical protein [Candidatus Babeliaceae bacterium]